MTKHLLLAAAALAAAWTATPVSAQVVVRHRQPQTPHHARHESDLARAARRAARIAEREAPGHRFSRVTRRLAEAARRGRDGRLDRLYRRARRQLVAGNLQPSDALLDAWDAVVVAHRGTAQRPSPRPRPRPRPAYEVEGRFERTPFRFVARDLDELDRSCMSFTSAIDTRWMDDVVIGEQRMRNGARYWDARALCSLVVLNATRAGEQPILTGSIERVPFRVAGPASEARRILSTHLPRLTREMRVDDMVIAGRTYRNGPSYWSPEQIVAMITAQLPQGGRHGRRWNSRGRVERVAFDFTADSAQSIETQCRAFVRAAVRDRIDDVEVHGRRLRNRRSYWSVEEVCRVIATQAQPS